MPRRYVPSLGEYVTFPSGWSQEQQDEWVASQSGGGETDIVGALKHGWKSGWADTADSYSDYKDALFRLIPGVDPKEGFLDRASQRLSEDAQAEGVPDTLAEKIASGVGAIPAGLVGLIPAIGITAGATLATGGNPIAGGAIGFGAHGAVRNQDQGALKAAEGAALGALEGGAFGALGKFLGPLKGLKGKELTNTALKHAGGSAAIGGMSTAAHQEMAGQEADMSDVIASGAVMGLLGLTPLAKGKLAEKIDLTPRVPEGTVFEPVGRGGKTEARLAGRKGFKSPLKTNIENIASVEKQMIAAGKDPFGFSGSVEEQIGDLLDRLYEPGDIATRVISQFRANAEGAGVRLGEKQLSAMVKEARGLADEMWGIKYDKGGLTPKLYPEFAAANQQPKAQGAWKPTIAERVKMKDQFGPVADLVKRRDIQRARSLDEHFMKYLNQEEQLVTKQRLAEGRVTREQLIEELRAKNKMLPVAMLEINDGAFAESFLTGKARDITRFTIEDANKISREAYSLSQKADQAKAAGAPNARELRQLADDAEFAARLAYASGSELTSEAGRTLGALNALRRDFSIGDEAIARLQRQKLLTKDTMQKIRELESQGKFDEIRKIAGASFNPKLSDKIHEMWIMGLLSSPLTWGITGVNVASNTAYMGLRTSSKLLGSKIDKYFGGKTGMESSQADLATVRSGFGAGLMSGWKAMTDAVKNEKTYQSGKLEMQHGPAIGGKLGQVVRLPGRMLTAGDEFFRTMAHSQEVAYMFKEKHGRAPSVEEVGSLAKKIWDKPLEHVNEINRIRKAGNEAVFTTSLKQRQQEGDAAGVLGTFGGWAQDIKAKPGIAGRAAGVVMPFVRTPTNIAIEAVKMSPLGLFVGAKNAKKLEMGVREYQAAKAAGKSQKQLDAMKQSLMTQQRELSYDLSKAAIGTGVFALMMSQAEEGNLTGGGPVDYPDYQKWIEAGNKPYSFRWKKDGPWMSYQRIEPFASIIGAAADIHESKNMSEDKMGKLWAAMKDNLANKTFLMGVENFAQAWADPERYGESAWRNIASTAIPFSSALGWAARATDPVVRITAPQTETDNPIGGAIANMATGIAAKVPGLRQQLEPRYSTTGRVLENDYSMLNALSPIKVASSQAPAKVEAELNRLNQLGFTMPSAENRRRKVSGMRGTQLVTPEEYRVFADTNKKAAETLERIVSAPSWDSLQDETKANIISSVYRRYRRVSSAKVRSSMRNRLSP